MTRRIVRAIAHTPILGVVLGLLVLVAGAAIGWSSWQSAQAFAEGPRALSMDDAVALVGEGELYVSITEGVVPACEQALSEDRTTYVPIRTGDDGVEVLAYHNDARDCASLGDAPLEGTLEPMNARLSSRLAAAGVAFAPAPLALCTYCGAGNAQAGMVLGGLFVLAGLVLAPLGFVLAGQLAKGTAPEWLR